MKEWGSEPDEMHDKLLLAEGFLVGLMVLGIYVLVSLEMIPTLCRWVLLFFG